MMEAMGMEVPPSPKDGSGAAGITDERAETVTSPSGPHALTGSSESIENGTESGTSDYDPAKAVDLLEDRPRQFFKCKKGHVTEDMWAHVARENEQGGEIIEDSGPICRICFVRWVKKMFPAKRCAPPKDVEKAA